MPVNAGSGESRERDFNFTEGDFERVRCMIHASAGIALSSAKRDMVYSRLSRRLRAVGIDSFEDYLDLVAGGDSEE